MKPAFLTFAAVSALLVPSAGTAQQVVADIHVRHGPVSGHIVLGHPPVDATRTIIAVGPGYHHPRHGYRSVVVYRGHRGHGWYRHRGYRAVRLWYDPGHDCYYDRYDRRDGLRAVVVYERGGRYYRDGWDDRDDRGYRERGRDNHDRYDDDYGRKEHARMH